VRTGRHYLGYDTDEAYAKAARERVAREVVALGAAPAPAASQPDKAAGSVRALLTDAGFTLAPEKVAKRRHFAGGLVVDCIATDASGGEGLVLLAGGFTVTRNGLRRTDVLFRTLGEASVLTAAGHRVLVLTTDLPAPRSAPLAALRDARGVSLVDVLELGAPGVPERLAAYAAGGVEAPIGALLPGS
jgi:hypothetical protein